MSTPAATPATTDSSQQLVQMQAECIASLKLNVNLMDEKIGMAVQAAEVWKGRYEALEKQALDLQSKYMALLNPPAAAPAPPATPATPAATGTTGQVD